MKPYVWKEGMSLEEQKNGAYWERNLLALYLAIKINSDAEYIGNTKQKYPCGWYEHEGEGFEGWSRVISINEGAITFHVPDDFDLGWLPKTKPNWDGHSTEEKWNNIMDLCGIKVD